jgi:hypothetical protein
MAMFCVILNLRLHFTKLPNFLYTHWFYVQSIRHFLMGSGVEPVPDPVLYRTPGYGTLVLSDTDTSSVLIGLGENGLSGTSTGTNAVPMRN